MDVTVIRKIVEAFGDLTNLRLFFKQSISKKNTVLSLDTCDITKYKFSLYYRVVTLGEL